MFASLGGLLYKAMIIIHGNRYAAFYSLALIAVFSLVYHFMGIKKHFDVPEYLKGREDDYLSSLYTSVLAQSNAMPDTTPKSNVARVLFMLQVTMGWMWFLLFNERPTPSIIVL